MKKQKQTKQTSSHLVLAFSSIAHQFLVQSVELRTSYLAQSFPGGSRTENFGRVGQHIYNLHIGPWLPLGAVWVGEGEVVPV